MAHYQHTITISTEPYSLTNFTGKIQDCLEESGIEMGIVNVFVQHTSASLIIQENADPNVLKDLELFMKELVPESRHYYHADEGPDDMPAHIRSALTLTSLNIPFSGKKLQLGMWQGVYLWEHRSLRHQRKVIIHING